jgi:hypothetical protein
MFQKIVVGIRGLAIVLRTRSLDFRLFPKQ